MSTHTIMSEEINVTPVTEVAAEAAAPVAEVAAEVVAPVAETVEAAQVA